MNARNCVLAILSALGNNSQQSAGAAAGVTVGVEGGKGFANGLAAGDSIVLFGPGEFRPEIEADENGTVTVPVQGRAQKRDVPEGATQVDKVFSVILEASLDPTNASTVSRSFADDVLCASTALGGGGFRGTASECVNALLDIMKQFRWDLGEFDLPLTDWSAGWVVNSTFLGIPVTGTICDDSGKWTFTIAGPVQGGSYAAKMMTAIDTSVGQGSFHLQGTLTYGGVSLPHVVDGVASLTVNADGSARLDTTAADSSVDSPIGTFNAFGDGVASFQLQPAITECIGG